MTIRPRRRQEEQHEENNALMFLELEFFNGHLAIKGTRKRIGILEELGDEPVHDSISDDNIRRDLSPWDGAYGMKYHQKGANAFRIERVEVNGTVIRKRLHFYCLPQTVYFGYLEY